MTLADNSWLELGMPAADPKWGRARGRAWTARMPLAPNCAALSCSVKESTATPSRTAITWTISGPTKNALMLYDRVNDVVLLVVHSWFDSDKGKLGVYIYDPPPIPGRPKHWPSLTSWGATTSLRTAFMTQF